ncbi:hypothetical protein GCM10007908_09760 [Rhizobium albus]|nr:hypothetical protein GCM10007908_09760 [Rhizobium albus]
MSWGSFRSMLLAAAAVGLSAPAVSQDRAAEGFVSIEATDGSVVVTGSATAVTAGTYDVALSVIKEGASGRAATRQGNAVTLAAGETQAVGRMGFNLQRGDALSATIEVSQNGIVVSRSSSEVRY